MSTISNSRTFSLVIIAGVITTFLLASNTFALQQQNKPTRNEAYSYAPPTQEAGSTNALNWAGYVATGGTYTSVSGSWEVPSVASSVENVADATWVGIGGVTQTDLIQAGTEAIPTSDGRLVYQAWYETLPQDSRVVPLAISAGDSVSVSITETSTDLWEISFYDATTGKMYDTIVRYASSLSSADWIEEMPIEVGGVVSLDDFGVVNFTSGYAIKNGEPVTIQSAGARALTMDNAQGEAVATPSALAASGAAFSVSRTNAASTPLALSRSGISVVAAASSPYASAGGYGYNNYGYGGGYTIYSHRGRGGYRIVIQF